MPKIFKLALLLLCVVGIYFISQDCESEHSFFKIATQEGINEIFAIEDNINPNTLPPADTKKTLKIPAISHRIWLTADTMPKEIPEVDLKHVINTIKLMNNSFFKWQHIIWTNKPAIKLSSLKRLKDYGVEIMDIALLGKELNQKNLEIMLSKNSFSEASDLIRYLALKKYGGVYVDTDFELLKPIDNLMQQFDFIAAEHLYYYYSNDSAFDTLGSAFIAASASNPIIIKTVEIIERNLNVKNLPKYISNTCYIRDIIWVKTGPMALTVAFYLSNNVIKQSDIGIFKFKYFYRRCHESLDLNSLGCHDFNGNWFGSKEKEKKL